MVGSENSSRTDGSLNAEALLSIGVVVAGVVTLTDALPELVQLITYTYYPRPEGLQHELDASQWGVLASVLMRIVIGVGLLIGHRVIAKLVRKARDYT